MNKQVLHDYPACMNVDCYLKFADGRKSELIKDINILYIFIHERESAYLREEEKKVICKRSTLNNHYLTLRV
jgi:hypothetical protein